MADDFPQWKALQRRVDELERDVVNLKAEVRLLLQDGRGYRADLDRWVFLVMGDEDLGLVGLVERVKRLEAGRDLDRDSTRIRSLLVVGFLAACVALLVVFLLFMT